MEETRVSGPKQFSVVLDAEDYENLLKVVKHRRSNIAQVVREFIISGIDQDRRIASLLNPTESVAS